MKTLREILEKLVQDEVPVLLSDGSGEWEPRDLLDKLSEPMLRKRAHLQAGLYIAEISSGGYLGEVLYKIKKKG